jgi:vesicle-fusing ATPase
MGKAFWSAFQAQVFTRGQLLAFDFKGFTFSVSVVGVEVVDTEALKNGRSDPSAPNSHRGVLMQQTSVQFVKAPDSTIRLKGGRQVQYHLYRTIQKNLKPVSQ